MGAFALIAGWAQSLKVASRKSRQVELYAGKLADMIRNRQR